MLPWWLSGKEPTCQSRRRDLIPDQKNPLEKQTATHSSILAWEIPWTEEPEGATVHGVTKGIRYNLATKQYQCQNYQEQMTRGKSILLLKKKKVNCVKVYSCSVAQSCPTLCDPMDCSTSGFPVLHHLLEFAQTHIHWVANEVYSSCSILNVCLIAFFGCKPYNHHHIQDDSIIQESFLLLILC